MPNALNVLHVYSGNLFGGVERMLISLAALKSPGTRSHFALCFEGKLAQILETQGAPIYYLNPVRLRNPLSAIRARRALARVLSTGDFDAIVCHSIWVYCIFSSTIARAGRTPILFLHDIPNPRGALYRWAWRKPPAICIANSLATARPVKALGGQVQIRIVHPLVNAPPPPDREAALQLRAQWSAHPGDAVILMASRFDALKGHRHLLEALAAMRDVSNWRCWIAGAPQRPPEEAYQREILQLTESLGLKERVSFIGHRDDMETALAACDVYCQPNETPEAFGLVFIEAMYAGKPVVGRALGGALEIVTPECGFLCAPGAMALTAALRSLVSDPQLRQRAGEGGPARAGSLCGPEAFTQSFRAALESVPGR